jgi:hypothetical protein
MRREGVNNLWWVPFKRWLFGVKSFYSAMACNDSICVPWKSVWQTKFLWRVALFNWSTALGKIHSTNNFKKQHITVVNK